MIKIKALNEPSSPVDEDFDEPDRIPVTKEVQEEHLLSLYFGALRQIDSDEDTAKEKLNDLLAYLNRLDKDHGLSNVEHLKYLALKNLGLIIPDSLTPFVDALCLDDRDVTLWIETGKRALDHFLNLPLARYCFEQALLISKNNWIAIDSLVDIYFMLNDYRNCFHLCLKSLEFAPDYSKAHFLISEIIKVSISLRKELPISLQWILDWKPPEKSFKILECFQAIKDRRKRKFIEDQEKIERKRQKLALNLDTISLSLSSLGLQIQKICNDIRKHHTSMNSPVSIVYETRADEISSTDESVSDDNVEKERCKPKSKGSQEFPFEFVDKRRSSRVQRNQSRSNDSCELTNDGIFGKVSSLFPNFAVGMENELKLSQAEMSKPGDQSVENRIVEQFISRQKACKRSAKRISAIIDDLIFNISANSCAIKVPSFFTEFYTIHRSLNELPSPTIVEIGKNVSLDELKLMLTALEVEYSNEESAYLTQMLIHLETAMTPEEYDNFFLRLLIQRGCKESHQDLISEAIAYMELKHINCVSASNKVVYQPNLLRSMQNSLTENSLSVLLDQRKYQEIMDILIPKPELSDSEQDILCQAIEESEEWQKGLDVVARTMNFSQRFLRMVRTCLKKDRNLRIFREFADNLLKFAIDKCNGLAWACLLNMIVNEVKNGKGKEKVIELISVIHQFMAKKGSCTHSDGEFLLTASDYLFNRCGAFMMDELILQCFSCLYHHPPSKRIGPIYLQPHSSSVKLKWENVDTIYCYFVPDSDDLPAFDSIKSNSIDSETEILLRKIIPLIPPEHNPMKDAKIVDDYLKLGTSLKSNFITKPHYITQNIYYFLADFYFKNKEFKRARDHYVQDLALNLNRFDSWAACALSIGKIIENTLLRGDAVAREYDKISQMADSASRCYSQALKIEPENTKIWIEYGNLSYIVASHFSRLRKALKEKLNGEDESVETLEKLEKKMLNQARESFEAASNTDHEDEKWLQYYFLGKIAEKMNSLEALQYYEYSDLYLAKSGAAYPRKIDYHKPPKLSIEALEIHYRTHACALKYLKSRSKISKDDLRTIMIHLLRALRSSFVKRIRHSSSTHSDHEHVSSQENSSSQKFSRISDDVREVMEDVLGIIEFEHEKYSRRRLKVHLEEICLEAMHRCLLRFSNHYKSLYCLAHHFYVSGDYPAARIILLGRFTASAVHEKAFMNVSKRDATNQSEQTILEPITGLFAEHKSNNLFNGIWRIPVDDIDRSNSFSAHMFRSTRLLIKTASALKDLTLLSTVATQLSKTPDVGKKYMSDMDRLRLVRDAAKNCVSLLPSKLAEAKSNETPMDQTKGELKKVFDQLMKCNVNDEETVRAIIDSRKLLQNE